MRLRLRSTILLMIFLPIFVSASTIASCNNEGYSVIYVNGILTSKQKADDDRDALQRQFSRRSNVQGIEFYTGYNESHIAGGGDIAQSAAQIVGKSFLEFDRDTILMQIHPQVSTQKILLLGH